MVRRVIAAGVGLALGLLLAAPALCPGTGLCCDIGDACPGTAAAALQVRCGCVTTAAEPTALLPGAGPLAIAALELAPMSPSVGTAPRRPRRSAPAPPLHWPTKAPVLLI